MYLYKLVAFKIKKFYEQRMTRTILSEYCLDINILYIQFYLYMFLIGCFGKNPNPLKGERNEKNTIANYWSCIRFKRASDTSNC